MKNIRLESILISAMSGALASAITLAVTGQQSLWTFIGWFFFSLTLLIPYWLIREQLSKRRVRIRRR